MNKTRHMVALQAKAFSDLGYGVFQIDLFGCGDSCGEFKESRWEIWKQDILCALKWIMTNTPSKQVNLWGLRLGALLILDFIRDYKSDFTVKNIVLWQPVLDGHAYLTQFLRMNLVKNLHLNGHQNRGSVNQLRKLSHFGKLLEIAGYELAPELIDTIDNLKLNEMLVTEIEVHWFDIVSDLAQPITPAKRKIMDAWDSVNGNLHVHSVVGPAFWATQEITECPNLLSATTKIFTNQNAI